MLLATVGGAAPLRAQGQVKHVSAGENGGFPNEEVRELFASGHGVARGRWLPPHRWILVAPPGARGGYVTDTTVPQNLIRERWEEGRRIIDVSHGNRYWLVVMSPESGLREQGYRTSATWPREYVEERYGEGYMITSLAFGDSVYFVVTSKGSPYESQRVRSDTILPAMVRQAWEDNFLVTNLVYARGWWTTVQSRTRDGWRQRYLVRPHWPQAEVDSALREGFEITDASYGNGLYAIMLTRFTRAAPAGAAREREQRERVMSDGAVEQADARLASLRAELRQVEMQAELEEEAARRWREQSRYTRGSGFLRRPTVTGSISPDEQMAIEAERRAKTARERARQIRFEIEVLLEWVPEPG